ncbi:SIMPL domain-containing protein [Bacillus sp. FJAT-50079]|uniref:SIMPL domain-containing protein n=1 Tax=Bacillus sp. FJAT-50079 TaxID=2833577 RepID=UPI001BC99F45|nr:SIMPL domain-containing protein [Bacillus sp. FJAT-50079]MBS4208013.1 SIMPL domain-containing protein [Bacillus sp. FJAT-50079]
MHEQACQRPVNMIKVNGEGKISIQPDVAEVTLGVATEEPSLEQAQGKNAATMATIKHALHRIGIQDEQIQTTNYSIYPQYDFVDGKQIFRGYRVEHMLRITVKQIDRTGLVVDTAVNNGANIVSGTSFNTSHYNYYYQHALSSAIINASQKAETIAQTLGIQLVKPPSSVTELSRQQSGPIPYQATALLKSEAATSVEPGTMEIISHVVVEFTY